MLAYPFIRVEERIAAIMPQPSTTPLYLPRPATITAVSDLTAQEKLFRLELANGEALCHQPGQFVQLSILGFGEAPFSVASSPTRSGYFELGVRRAGALTTALHRLAPGTDLGIRGPFGRPFELSRLTGRDLLIIAGGCGLAPLRSLIEHCQDSPEEFGRVTVLYGAKSPQDILFRDDLQHWQRSGQLHCTTIVDQITEGHCHDGPVGLVTRLIDPLTLDAPRTVAAVVGPPAMYRPVLAALATKGLPPTQIAVSLERQMRCGVGKCGHCAIEHLYCCTDGPVFWLDELAGVVGAI
jgi:sulfhydrogenase subunit gamma (sulfur reductase)